MHKINALENGDGGKVTKAGNYVPDCSKIEPEELEK